jgi:hypothetical protein
VQSPGMIAMMGFVMGVRFRSLGPYWRRLE